MLPKQPTVGKVKPGITFFWQELWPPARREDTQQSQTISTESRKIARTVACNSTPIEWGCPPVLTGETSLIKIKLLAQSDPELVFTSVVHRIDFD